MKMNPLERSTYAIVLSIVVLLLVIFVSIFRVSNVASLLIIASAGILLALSALSRTKFRFILLAIFTGALLLLLLIRHEGSALYVFSVLLRFLILGLSITIFTPRITDVARRIYLDIQRLADEREHALNESRRWLLRANALVQVTTAIVTRGMQSGLDEVLKVCLEEAGIAFSADSGLIYRVDRKSGKMSIISSFGYDDALLEKMKKKGINDSALCEACQRMNPVVTNNLATDEKCKNLGPVRTGSSICVPITTKNNLWGVLHLRRMRTDAFTEEDTDLARAVAFQFAIAMQRAYLFDQLNMLAVTDELTGLYNFRKLREDLEREIIRSKRYNHNFSFIMGDIDHFKNLNDTYGHQSGDAVLKEIARALNTGKREVDRAYRYGGEEFALVLPETMLDEALEVAEKLRKKVEELKVIPPAQSEPLRVTISMGVSSYPTNGTEADTIIGSADKALYASKQAGRNRVFAYRSNMALNQ